jgi:hypothetical protein
MELVSVLLNDNEMDSRLNHGVASREGSRDVSSKMRREATPVEIFGGRKSALFNESEGA